MSRMANLIKYSIYPRRCDVCGRVVSVDENVCSDCADNIRIVGKICLNCGKAKADCNCKKEHHKPSYDGIIAPFMFDKNVPRAIYNLKFFGRSELAEPMGHQISTVVKERFGDIEFDYVTFVPLTFRRNYKRGYNQSRLLAKTVSKDLGIECKPLLKKLFNNPPQRTLSAKYRRGNVFGVYDVKNMDILLDKTILVIDDVKTTGATLNNCAYVLKMYGAKSVYAATFAIR